MHNHETIKSRDNAKLKFARRVRDGKEAGLIFIEGARLCDEAVASDISVTAVFMSESYHASGPDTRVQQALKRKNTEMYVVSDSLFGSIADTKTPQGIVLIAQRPKPQVFSDLISFGNVNLAVPLWIYLCEINNPSNLGAVMRTAEGAGAKGVIVSPNSADPYSPKSLRASMGSAFRIPIVENIGTEHAYTIAKQKGIKTRAVDARGEKSYIDVDWKTPGLLVFGSEARGLPDEVLSRSDERIKIPMDGNVESLNLAVSTGIILFEAKRQFKTRG
jgi:TrmH family RNA methyltransferase